MVSTPLKRVVAVVVLLGCQTPGAFALTAGLELAAHALGFGLGHEHDVAELLRSATHGHHHDEEVVPEHEHEATLDDAASLPPPVPSSWAALAEPFLPATTFAERPPWEAASRRGPPSPLFRSHCALLL